MWFKCIPSGNYTLILGKEKIIACAFFFCFPFERSAAVDNPIPQGKHQNAYCQNKPRIKENGESVVLNGFISDQKKQVKDNMYSHDRNKRVKKNFEKFCFLS